VKTILSVQSAVAYGHVGNSAAVFPLQRLGHEVWPVYTVNFSNHTGYGAWRGPLIPPDDVREVVSGIEDRGVLGEVDLVLSGYQGSEGIADVILDAVERVKRANPDALYACDPVMGNARSGCFVAPAIPAMIRDRVVPAADIMTPNQFELGYLVGREEDAPQTLEEILAAVDEGRAKGPRTLLVTSVEHADREPGTIGMMAVDGDGAWLVETPQLPLKANGSGDVTAALFSALLVDGGDPVAALEQTTGAVFGLLQATLDSGQRELQLVQAQEEYVAPSHTFTATKLR
jgi:pyridoxine kinase